MVAHSEHSQDETIINSPITWQMLEVDFQREMGTTAKLGPKRKCCPIAEGNGYVSFMALVDFDWSENDGSLPEKALLKITTTEKLKSMEDNCEFIEMSDLTESCAILTDNELHFYRNAHKVYHLPEEIRIPKYYCGREFGTDGVEAGYFAIEFFDKVDSRHMYHNVQESAILEILSQQAILAAHSLNHPEYFADASQTCYDTLFADFCSAVKISEGITKAIKKRPELTDELELLKSALKNFQSFDDFKKFSSEMCKIKVFRHGDAWLGNMLWQKQPNGDYKMLVFIDWQICHLGNPLEDVVRLFTSAFGPTMYHEKRDIFLKHFYDVLHAQAPKVQKPWKTFEEFVMCFEKMWISTALWFGPMCINTTNKMLETCKENIEECKANFNEKVRLLVTEAARFIQKYNM